MNFLKNFVTGNTPLLLRKNNIIIINTIDNLGKSWKSYHNTKLQDDNIDYEVWSDKGWTKIHRVIKHKTTKNIYEIITNKGTVNVTEDHSLLNEYGDIIKPTELTIESKLLTSHPNIPYTQNIAYDKNNLNCKTLYNYIRTNIYNDNEFKILEINKNQNLESTDIWVYDLETDNHHFHAGTGELIVHNTDSVFFNMNFTDKITGLKQKDKTGLCMGIKFGIWAGIMICTILPMPMQMAFEKVLWPFVIQGKKRYVGNLYEKNPNKFYQKSMGIELKRRDNAPIVKIVCSGIIDEILNKHSAKGAYDFTINTLQKIITGQYKMDKYTITKTLKGNALTKKERLIEAIKLKENRSYANRLSIVHAVLADRIADRDPGNKPLSNDRVPYIYIETKGEPKLQGDRVESPEYIIKHKLKIDYLFYITNQIMKPALKFLELIVEDADNIFKQYIIKEENRKKCMMPIAYYATNEKLSDTSDNKDNEYINFEEFDCSLQGKMKEKKIKTIKNKEEKIVNMFNTNNSLFDDNTEYLTSHTKKSKNTSTKKSKNISSKKSNISNAYISTSDLFN